MDATTCLAALDHLATTRRRITIQSAAAELIPAWVTTGMTEAAATEAMLVALRARAARGRK